MSEPDTAKSPEKKNQTGCNLGSEATRITSVKSIERYLEWLLATPFSARCLTQRTLKFTSQCTSITKSKILSPNA